MGRDSYTLPFQKLELFMKVRHFQEDLPLAHNLDMGTLLTILSCTVVPNARGPLRQYTYAHQAVNTLRLSPHLPLANHAEAPRGHTDNDGSCCGCRNQPCNGNGVPVRPGELLLEPPGGRQKRFVPERQRLGLGERNYKHDPRHLAYCLASTGGHQVENLLDKKTARLSDVYSGKSVGFLPIAVMV